MTHITISLAEIFSCGRISRTFQPPVRRVTAQRGAAINQSLSALSNVITALAKAETERGQVTYRDSKLTYLLSDSLGRNSVTLMIACLSPKLDNIDESLSAQRFAQRTEAAAAQRHHSVRANKATSEHPFTPEMALHAP